LGIHLLLNKLDFTPPFFESLPQKKGKKQKPSCTLQSCHDGSVLLGCDQGVADVAGREETAVVVEDSLLPPGCSLIKMSPLQGLLLFNAHSQ